MDFIFNHDHPDFLVKRLTTVEKLAHSFHMQQIWMKAQVVYQKLKSQPPKNVEEVCRCANDVESSGILSRLIMVGDTLRDYGDDIPQLLLDRDRLENIEASFAGFNAPSNQQLGKNLVDGGDRKNQPSKEDYKQPNVFEYWDEPSYFPFGYRDKPSDKKKQAAKEGYKEPNVFEYWDEPSYFPFGYRDKPSDKKKQAAKEGYKEPNVFEYWDEPSYFPFGYRDKPSDKKKQSVDKGFAGSKYFEYFDEVTYKKKAASKEDYKEPNVFEYYDNPFYQKKHSANEDSAEDPSSKKHVEHVHQEKRKNLIHLSFSLQIYLLIKRLGGDPLPRRIASRFTDYFSI